MAEIDVYDSLNGKKLKLELIFKPFMIIDAKRPIVLWQLELENDNNTSSEYDKYILNHYILTAGDRYRIVNDFSSQKEAEEYVDRLVRLLRVCDSVLRVFDDEMYDIRRVKV